MAVLDSDSSKIESIEPNSPAATAGLKAGDRIVAVDKQPVTRSLDFHRAMLGRKAGESVQVTVRRGDESLDFSLSLAEAPATSPDWAKLVWEELGVAVEEIPAEQFRRTFRTRYRGGMSVVGASRWSAADQESCPATFCWIAHLETLSMKNVAYDEPADIRLLARQGVHSAITPLYGYPSVSMARLQR